MAGIKQPIQDLLTLLSTVNVVNQDGNATTLYTRIWNNQLKDEEQGKLYAYAKPAAFVEVINNAQFEEIGIGFQSCDIGFRVHLIHEYYNSEVTFEQDLTIFDLRDSIVATLSHVQLTACGPLVKTAETQDYTHDNLYHYIIDFICNFTDSKGSYYDTAAGKYIYYGPPTGLNILATKGQQSDLTGPIISTQPYNIQ